MSIPAFVHAFKTFGYHAEVADTVIDEEVPGRDGERLALVSAYVTAAATAHTLYLMYAEGTGSRNTTSAVAAAAQKVINVNDTPKSPAGDAAAANDIVAYKTSAGNWFFDTIASVSTKAITMTTNVPTGGIDSGAQFLIFGIVGDGANFPLAIPASAQKIFGPGELVVVHPYSGEPFYVSDTNASNAGSIDNLVFAYLGK